MRDFQRSKVYAAEFRLRDLYDIATRNDNPVVELDGITLTLPPEAKFGSIESLQRYVDRVLPNVTVRAYRGESHAIAYSLRREIAIPDYTNRWAMREIVVLHELAHIETDVSGHGPEFVTTFTDLLGRVMGPEAALAYRILCDHAGVKFTVS